MRGSGKRRGRKIWLLCIIVVALVVFGVQGVDAIAVKEVRQLTFECDNSYPSWSPDGKKIVFISGQREGQEFEDLCYHPLGGGENWIWIMDADGSNRRQLNITLRGTAPSWSPDGKKIAFGANGSIYIVDINTSTLTQITDSGWKPSWSPDGTMIAFERRLGIDAIIIKDLNTLRETYYYLLPRSPGAHLSSPSWSPDGTKIAFWFGWKEIYFGNAPKNLNDPLIEWINGEGLFKADVTRLADSNKVFPGRVTWSPDSKMLAFDHFSGIIYRGVPYKGHFDIFLIGIDGTNLTQLTERGINEWSPAWSPDGDKIVFVREGKVGQGQIHVMYLDFTPTEESFPAALTLFIFAILIGSVILLLVRSKKWRG